MQGVLERELQVAREQLKRGNKQLALLALKKRKYQEQLLLQSSNQLFNLEQMVTTSV